MTAVHDEPHAAAPDSARHAAPLNRPRMTTAFLNGALLLAALVLLDRVCETAAAEDVQRTVLLPPGPGNPRNSEGDVVTLRDGRLMLVYTHFFGGSSDHAEARLAARYSSDGGRTWTAEDRVVLENEAGWNVMSVSLLRLADGRLALFYLRKNSLTDCRPCLRISNDEGESWSEPTVCIPDEEIGYYVLNNDRAVQLENGRLVLPVARHHGPEREEPDWAGRIMCYLSDDGGRNWRRSQSVLEGRAEDGTRWTAQEPGIVPLRDGRLWLWCRSNAGVQLEAFSEDRGDTWSPLRRSPIVSPLSPATIERIPSTGDLMLVWNDHRDIADAYRGKRTPFNVAVSRDDGRTWSPSRILEDDPQGWYCYTAIAFHDGNVILAHCAGNRPQGTGLGVTQITRFPVTWLYGR